MFKLSKLLLILAVLLSVSCTKEESIEPQKNQAEQSLYPLINDFVIDSPQGILKHVSNKDFIWPNGSQITFSFKDGSSQEQAEFERAARQWMAHANIKFLFMDSFFTTDVVVEFKEDIDMGFGEAYLRSDFKKLTIWVGSKGFKSNSKEFHCAVKHEIGHLLGLFHEHQNPNANIPWNKQAVYNDLTSQGWTKEDVDIWILNKYPTSSSKIQYSAFDRNSIMCYVVPNKWTIGNYEIPQATTLSAMDKSEIEKIYPFGNKRNLYEFKINGKQVLTTDYYEFNESQFVRLAGRIRKEKVGNADPIYRYYNTITNENFLTSIPTEKKSGTGWVYKGIIGYNATGAEETSWPLWRFKYSQSYYYTFAPQNTDPNNEGIAFYLSN